MKITTVNKLKKFDLIQTCNGPKTVDKLILSKGCEFAVIQFMDKSKIHCLSNEEVEFKRDNFYALTHKEFIRCNELLEL